MTNKEYLRQAYRLDQKINSYIREAARLRSMASNISLNLCSDRVQTSPNHEAPFVRVLEKLSELELNIQREVNTLVNLRAELSAVVDAVPDKEEQTILRLRYLCGMKWEDIASELDVSPKTVRRRHGTALRHVVQPEKNLERDQF